MPPFDVSVKPGKTAWEAAMKTRHLPCETLRSLAGLALAGVGIFLLTGRLLTAADRLSRVLDHTASATGEFVSWIMLASSLNTHRLGYDLLTLLWPLVPGLLGTVLLWSTTARQNTRGDDGGRPCVRWA
jgi:hypothetical protein